MSKNFARRFLRIVAVIAIQLLIFIALLEVVARVIDPIGISYYNETARFFDEIIVEEPIGYRMRPGLKGHFNGVPVAVNELGMRDRPVPETKAPGEYRLLAMGDSVMFSVGVPVEDSIPMQLEGLANAAAPDGITYRVLNMGVPSYNTVQELEQLKSVGQYLQADAAMLFIIPNDLEDKMWVLSKRANIVVDMAQRSYALGLLFYTGRWLLGIVDATLESGAPVNDEVAPEPKTEAELTALDELKNQARARALANPGWVNIENSLLEINRILRAQGVPLLVFHRESFRTTYVGRLRELGEQEGFAVRKLDVFSDPRWADLDRADYVNSPVDSHCNPAGCALYATAMYEMLLETGLLQAR